jgi:DNA-binding MarR family transcriptional regulator
MHLISENPGLSQRAIATHSGVSLGLVNLILKRLIETGHVKIANLNRKKVHYILTPKGFIERANFSYSYVSQILKVFLEYQKRLLVIVDDAVRQNQTLFAILGGGEIAELVEIALRNYPAKISFRRLIPGESAKDQEVVLDCRMNGEDPHIVGIHVLSALLQGKGNGNNA